MARFVKKQKNEIGLPPDEWYFRGNKKIDSVLLRVIDFDPDNLEENAIKTVKEVLKYQDRDTVTWFNVDGLHNKEVMEEIANGFKFDNLVLANVMDTQARPRVLEFSNCIFLSIKMLQQNENTGAISVENLSLIITDSVLISFQEKKGDVFEPIRERIRNHKKRIRRNYLYFP